MSTPPKIRPEWIPEAYRELDADKTLPKPLATPPQATAKPPKTQSKKR